ncbi:O-antigen ligase family protein [Aeoliella mucimassa]|uniref:O-Antigen ligase n=1 Tax=Aeoliella mucimassa TaxID=2527972 RepID=A0A518ANZ8_9BACT|nr:O-antigen ligase family protein [Aeoliella mucimassa]QDU56450.1 O-Antigen ligase [Aeoliella mucimassa]
MALIIVFAVLVALLWGAIAFRRFTPVGVAVATVAIGYVLGYEFWHLHLGPLPLTVDRLLLGVLVAALAMFAWQRKLVHWTPLTVDWAIFTLLGWLTVSCVLANVGSDADLPVSPFFRLLFSFWTPTLLYLAVRIAPPSTRTTTYVLAAFAALGTYLAVTACAEITQQWWAVFPKYITDPELGTHFGRARGPALNSVSLGNYLCLCFWATWTLRPRVRRSLQLVLLGCMGLMVLGILFTYTRSVWMGFALSAFVMLIAHTPREYRWPVAIGSSVCGALLLMVAWSFVLYLNREDSGSVSEHSVEQRTSFAYVSWKMWCDEPLAGVGFGRFFDKKLPYLSDRHQSFELESIRNLHHHNTFLGLVVETGLAGLAAYLAMLVGWIWIGYRMTFDESNSPAMRQMGRLLLAVLCVYLPSALFHDLTHIFQDQTFLFLIAGLALAVAEQHSPVAQPATMPNRVGFSSFTTTSHSKTGFHAP